MNIKEKLKIYQQDNQNSDIRIDYRKIVPNDVFFAIKGDDWDGNNFINDAITKQAGLIITETNQSKPSLQTTSNKFPEIRNQTKESLQKFVNVKPPEILSVENIQTTINDGIEIFYPSIPKNPLAVTGTNGKTSVVTYIQQLVAMLGKQSASIGTMGIETSLAQTEMTTGLQDVVNKPSSLTTPEWVDLRHELHHMATNDIHHVAFEASSHGIHEKRIGNLKAHCAGFTSFSQDHLDYHKDMDTYLAVKLSLFKNNLKNGGTVVINSEIKDIIKVKQFLDGNKINYVTVGKNSDLNIQKITPTLSNQTVEFYYLNRSYTFQTTILGSYQITNILIAAVMVHLCGFNFDSIVSKLHKLTAPKGRLERVTCTNHPFHVFVDFAHTPDAMDKALGELAKIKEGGKLKVVLGASGNRDRGKRPLMGQVASKWANEAIVTETNNRYEDGENIREQVISGMDRDKCTVMNIPNRIRAIELTIEGLRERDILLICGKGHQEYLHINGIAHPYLGDAAIVRQLLQKKSQGTKGAFLTSQKR